VILPGDKINIEFNKLHETESFLKLKVIYQIKKCLTFHVAEISLSWSKQQPLFLILSQVNLIHILTHYFFKIRFNIILPLKPCSPKWSLPFTFSYG